MHITVELLHDMLVAPKDVKRAHQFPVGTWWFGHSIFARSWEGDSTHLSAFPSNLLELVCKLDSCLARWGLKEDEDFESGRRAHRLLLENQRWKQIWPQHLTGISRDEPLSLDRVIEVSFSIPRDKLDYFVEKILYPAFTHTSQSGVTLSSTV